MPHCLSQPINFDVIQNAQIESSYLRQELTLPLEHRHLSIRHFCQYPKYKWIENIRKWADVATYQLKKLELIRQNDISVVHALTGFMLRPFGHFVANVLVRNFGIWQEKIM